MNEELNALKEWKLGGRGKTMSECIDWKNSHSQMFIEGYRVAKEKYCKEWHNLEENPNDLPIAVPHSNKSEYKWYLVEVSNSSPGESKYIICTRVHWLDYYGDGRGEDVWVDDMTMTYNVIKWKEID